MKIHIIDNARRNALPTINRILFFFNYTPSNPAPILLELMTKDHN
jgi:hypothetical protein